MSVYCENLFSLLAKDIEYCNDIITNNITNLNNEYKYSCVKSNMSYTYYSEILSKKWIDTINKINNNCLLNLNALTIAKSIPTETNDLINFVDNITKTINFNSHFNFYNDFSHCMASLLTIYFNNCNCEIYKLFKIMVLEYGKNYGKKFLNMNKEQVKQTFASDYAAFNNYIQQLQNFIKNPTNLFRKNKFFSLENELNQLIPNEIGKLMKSFFIKMIVTYYQNLHPVIWGQMFNKLVTKYFISMPLTQEDFFQYFSQNILLNSGPTILKIIQMIRPILTQDQLKKYNLNKLEYPLLTTNQVAMILDKILPNPNMYTTLLNVSASVGHVVIIKKIDQVDPFIIKIIKPISIVQSCYEYVALQKVFEKDSCEQKFIDNMIMAIGSELNVHREIENINNAHKYYTTNYKKVYNKNISSSLTTLEVINDEIDSKCWYALSVTLAPGIPLSKLVEGNILNMDSKYTASLHRCLDLLVYKFFYTILQHGFYHGDLHAGNIFFSYKMQQMTLIDFGAVGQIDLFSDDISINALIEIIIMSIFYNYDGILHVLTRLLNQLCGESKIDTTNNSFIILNDKMYKYREENLIKYDENKKLYQENIDLIFNDERIKLENVEPEINNNGINYKYEHIYDLLKLPIKKNEVIVENDVLLPKINIKEIKEKTLVNVLEEIFSYYAINNINVPVKFGELFEFQKAYSLLLGVLYQTNYNMSRMSYAITKAFVNKNHISKIWHISKVINIAKIYNREHNEFKKLRKHLNTKNQKLINENVNNLYDFYESNNIISNSPQCVIPPGYDAALCVYDKNNKS